MLQDAYKAGVQDAHDGVNGEDSDTENPVDSNLILFDTQFAGTSPPRAAARQFRYKICKVDFKSNNRLHAHLRLDNCHLRCNEDEDSEMSSVSRRSGSP